MGLGLGDAFADFGTTFRTGIRPSRSDVPDIGKGEAFLGKDILDPRTGAWRVGFLRGMSATDEFMRSLNSAGAQASEMARLMKANPDLSQEQILSRFGANLLEAGERGAAESVFAVGGTGVGKRMAEWRGLLTKPDATPQERVLGALTNVLVPFSNIPDVILTQGVKRLPIANELTAIAQLRSADPAVRRRAVASAVLSETINLAIVAQVTQGNITGNGPSDAARKATMMQARDENGEPLWQPNSVRIGGRWFPYASLGPVGIRMGAIANAAEQLDEEMNKANPSDQAIDRISSTALAALDGTSETVADAWYLQTVGRLFNAMKNGGVGEAIGQTALSTAQRVIPYGGQVRGVEQVTGPGVSEPRNPLEAIAANIPGLSQLATPRIDPTTGRPLERPADVGTFLTRSPAPGEPSPVATALAEHNLGTAEAPQTISKNQFTIPLTPDEQRAYSIESGKRIEQNVQRLLDNPRWSQQSQLAQRKDLEAAMATAREDATTILWNSLTPAERDRRIKLQREAQVRQAEPQFFTAP
jgi:hypothetical protein